MLFGVGEALSQVPQRLFERRDLAEPGAVGVEGLVVKGASTRYQPGRRDRVKVNSVGVEVFDERTTGTYDQVSNGSRGG